jgi:hypothetical protein
LYAAASPLKQKQNKIQKWEHNHTHTIKLQKENPETKSPKTNDT